MRSRFVGVWATEEPVDKMKRHVNGRDHFCHLWVVSCRYTCHELPIWAYETGVWQPDYSCIEFCEVILKLSSTDSGPSSAMYKLWMWKTIHNSFWVNSLLVLLSEFIYFVVFFLPFNGYQQLLDNCQIQWRLSIQKQSGLLWHPTKRI